MFVSAFQREFEIGKPRNVLRPLTLDPEHEAAIKAAVEKIEPICRARLTPRRRPTLALAVAAAARMKPARLASVAPTGWCRPPVESTRPPGG